MKSSIDIILEEIARHYGVPHWMLSHYERATFNNCKMTTLQQDFETEKKQYAEQIEVWQRRKAKAKADFDGEKELCENMVKVYQKKINLTDAALAAINGNKENTPALDASA
jgi:hypothetical protein